MYNSFVFILRGNSPSVNSERAGCTPDKVPVMTGQINGVKKPTHTLTFTPEGILE